MDKTQFRCCLDVWELVSCCTTRLYNIWRSGDGDLLLDVPSIERLIPGPDLLARPRDRQSLPLELFALSELRGDLLSRLPDPLQPSAPDPLSTLKVEGLNSTWTE